MGIRSDWSDDRQQLMIITIQSPWTWEEFRSMANQAFVEIQSTDHPVATIMDVSQIGKLPSGNFLGHLQFVDSSMPKNVFASVLVGAPYVVTSFMNILTRIRPTAKEIAFFATSFDEAKALVERRYQALYPEKRA